jgi:acyl carrier protein
MNHQSHAPAAPNATLEREIAAMIVSGLNLEVAPDDIQPEAALYGDGLGLDSIDILEVALLVSKRFGVQLKADSEDNFRIFSSLRSLTAYITEHRTK